MVRTPASQVKNMGSTPLGVIKKGKEEYFNTLKEAKIDAEEKHLKELKIMIKKLEK